MAVQSDTISVLLSFSLSLDHMARRGKSHRWMQFMTRERSLGLFRVSPWRVPMSGSLGLCMATYGITDAIWGTFDLSEPLTRILGDWIFDLSGFCEP